MTQTSIFNPASLAKKTKQEIIDEYQKLLANLPEARAVAKEAHSVQSQEATEKAKEQSLENITQAVVTIKAGVNNQLNDLALKFADNLRKLLQQFSDKVEEYNSLQAAIEISKKKLQNQYQVEVAAAALEDLIAEYAQKQKELEQELKGKKESLELEITAVKRAWEREQEEYDYTAKTQRQRDEEKFLAERDLKEKLLTEREEKIKQSEAELDNLRQTAANLPAAIQQAADQREQEAAARLQKECKDGAERQRQTWEAEKNVLEIKIKTLAEQKKEQETDIIILKKEAELANKKAQELAVKVIESGAKNWSEGKTEKNIETR
ncbi:MAG: hypothetical protein Q8Q23_01440 [bacterium]|nr:hypothetical protein [bacterium]